MNKLSKFFHELFNPHCPHCEKERIMMMEQEAVDRDVELANSREDRRCRSCESLERQLAVANEQIIKLTEKIVNPNPVTPIVTSEAGPKPLMRGAMPFHVLRRTLESESYARAQAMKASAKPDSEQVLQNNEPDKSVSSAITAQTEEFKELESAVLNAKTEREATAGSKQ